jgi:hypothetical protein
MPSTLLSQAGAVVGPGEEETPWRQWAALAFVAVAGSCLYGASLSLTLVGWDIVSAALWLALSAGLAWCVFMPVLAWVARVGLVVCFDACLATMAFGEVVLTSGALANVVLWSRGSIVHAAAINAIIVVISNVVMAVALASQLRARGVSIVRVLAAWMLALNGSGALFFYALYRVLHGP